MSMKKYILWLLIMLLASCSTQPGATLVAIQPTSQNTGAMTSSSTAQPSVTPSLPPTKTPRIVSSIDLTPSNTSEDTWSSFNLPDLPETSIPAAVTFDLLDEPVENRRMGQVSPTLVSRYVFLQFGNISLNLMAKYAFTMKALFIRSALMSFVDYAGGRVLDWDRLSARIPLDVKAVIALANENEIPVFLELNFSDHIPGRLGSGVEQLQPADNVAATISYLHDLQEAGLQITGVTFGDEIDDEAGFGNKKPTLGKTDLVKRYIEFATSLKTEFPELKMYAFDSNIAATRGKATSYLTLLQQIRQAELDRGLDLIDGFLFRESYVYMDENGLVTYSFHILDDTESLYRQAAVYRYDVTGVTHPHPNKDYLHMLIDETYRIFSRDLEIGLSEYLPAGPIQINESDTSAYDDIDFILHYSDMIGIYALLGLDYLSTWMFANSVNQAKCYLTLSGEQGVNYPVHAQIAEEFTGEMRQIKRTPQEALPKLKVYAVRNGERTFVMLLNKDTVDSADIRLVIPAEMELTLRLPQRSYTSVIVEGDQTLISIMTGKME